MMRLAHCESEELWKDKTFNVIFRIVKKWSPKVYLTFLHFFSENIAYIFMQQNHNHVII